MDPRVVFLIVLLVLLFLFFTSLAVFVKLFLIVLLALLITALIAGLGRVIASEAGGESSQLLSAGWGAVAITAA